MDADEITPCGLYKPTNSIVPQVPLPCSAKVVRPSVVTPAGLLSRRSGDRFAPLLAATTLGGLAVKSPASIFRAAARWAGEGGLRFKK